MPVIALYDGDEYPVMILVGLDEMREFEDELDNMIEKVEGKIKNPT